MFGILALTGCAATYFSEVRGIESGVSAGEVYVLADVRMNDPGAFRSLRVATMVLRCVDDRSATATCSQVVDADEITRMYLRARGEPGGE